MWHVMGVTQGCGLSLSWFKHNFASSYSYNELDLLANNITSDGIIFLPYLMGERTPHLNPNCRASFTGMSANNGIPNMYRAVLEGVCFSLKDCICVLKETGLDINCVSVCGGGSGSELWLQILSDIIENDVYNGANIESGALGVALLASVGAKVNIDIQSAYNSISKPKPVKMHCNYNNKTYYNELFQKYKYLYYSINNIPNNI